MFFIRRGSTEAVRYFVKRLGVWFCGISPYAAFPI